MSRKKSPSVALRPALLVSAVGLACQGMAYAQTSPVTASTVLDSPFANRPAHVIDDSTKTGAKGVKPNVMLLIDDSGSMIENLQNQNPQGGVTRCKYDPAKLLIANNTPQLQRCFNYKWGSRAWVRPNQTTKMDVLIGVMNELLDEFGVDQNGQERLRWNIQTLWGSETRHTVGTYSTDPNDIAYKNYIYDPGNPANPTNHGAIQFADGTRYAQVAPPIPGQTFRYIRSNNNEATYFSDDDSLVRWVATQNPEVYMTGVNSYQTNSVGPGVAAPFRTTLPPSHKKMMGSAEMRTLIDNLNPQGSTPTTHRYVMAAQTLRDNIEYRCQNNLVVVMSDGAANNGWFDWPGGIYGQTPPPWFPGRISTGETAFPHAGLAFFAGKNATTDLKTASDGVDKEGASWDDPEYPNQTIATHTIGFALSPPTDGRPDRMAFARRYLQNGAADGKGIFALADTPEQLKEAFRKALLSGLSSSKTGDLATTSASAPAVSGTSVAELAATLTLDTGKWSSELQFHTLAPSGGIVPGAATPADYRSRKVIVNNGTMNYWLDSTTPNARSADFGLPDDEFKRVFIPWLTRNGTPDESVKKYRDMIPMADVLDAPISALGRDSKGRQKFIVTAANDGMVYFFKSTEGASGATSPYKLELNYLPAGVQRESADDSITVGKAVPAIANPDYGKDNIKNPHLYLNNGGFSWVLTPSQGGLPREYLMLGTMGQGGRGAYAVTVGGKSRADRSGNTSAGLDAADWLQKVPMWETEKGNTNTLGYTIGSPQIAAVMTEKDNSGERNIDKGVRVAAFVANGYQAKDTGVPYDSSPALYVYDMTGQEFGWETVADRAAQLERGYRKGELIRKIEVGTDPTSGAPAGALSTPRLLDMNWDGVVDFAYAGDQFGNLYRFDLRGTPSEWKAHKIYQGDPLQPITVAPSLYPVKGKKDTYVVVFGTGSDIFESDRVTKADPSNLSSARRTLAQQIIMGIHDDLSVTVPPIVTANSTSIVDQSLQESAGTSGNRTRTLSANAFTGTTKAWRIKLNPGSVSSNGDKIIAAEKVVTNPEMLLSTVVINTRIYDFSSVHVPLPSNVDPNATCFSEKTEVKGKGSSWQMFINAETGSYADDQTGGYLTDSNGKNSLVAGKGYDGILSQSTIIDGGNNSNLQVKASGEVNSGGQMYLSPAASKVPNVDKSEDNPYKEQRLDCAPVGSTPRVLSALSGLNNPNSDLVNQAVGAPHCVVKMIRVNWREVPL